MNLRWPRIIFVILLVSLSLPGCATKQKPVVPQPITVLAPRFDGAHADSGLVGTEGSEFLVSEFARSRYNGLVARFGKDATFVVPLVTDFGLRAAPAELVTKHNRGTLYLMSPEAMTYFARMSRWQREGKLLP